MGAQLCVFSCVAVRMLGCIRRCTGAQGWACRLMGQRVYGTRMSRWIRRSEDVQARGSEDARVCRRVWQVKRASMLIWDCPAVGRNYTGCAGLKPWYVGAACLCLGV